MWGSRRDRETIPPTAPRRKSDYCLNIGITWSGLVALEIENSSQRYPSSHSVRSSKEPRNEPSWSAIPDQVRPRTGSAGLEAGTITSW